MLPIEKIALSARDEELAAVGVLPTVGHREEARLSVLGTEVLVCKGGPRPM